MAAWLAVVALVLFPWFLISKDSIAIITTIGRNAHFHTIHI
jgi:hypothetical protein